MGAINGSQVAKQIRQEAYKRYGNQLMSPEGVLDAALAEPCVEKDPKFCSPDDKADQAESHFWDQSCLNAIRVLSGLSPIEDYL